MSQVCMIIRCPDNLKDPMSLVNSICEQTYPDIHALILAPNPESTTIQSATDCLKRRNHSSTVLPIHGLKELSIRSILDSSSADYFCFPDPESILDPEFVSIMASFLDRNSDCLSVRCNGVFVDERDLNFQIGWLIDDITTKHPNPTTMETLLTKETCINAGMWMVRRSGIERSITSFSLRPEWWDWQFTLPFAFEGTVGFIDRNLLRIVHYSDGLMQKILKVYGKRTQFEKTFSLACLEIIKRLAAPQDKLDKWRNLIRITTIKSRINTDRAFRLWFRYNEYLNELAQIVESCGGDPKSFELDADSVKNLDTITIGDAVMILTYYYCDLLVGILLNRVPGDIADSILKSGFKVFPAASIGKRFYLYGGGAAARDILPFFLALGFRPQLIWDRSAGADQSLFGIPVKIPEFSAIHECDRKESEVIVAAGRPRPAHEIRKFLNEQGFQNVIHVCEAQGAHAYLQKQIWHRIVSNAHLRRIDT